MDYCKFKNAYDCLIKCFNDVDNINLVDHELFYRDKLISLVFDIARDYREKEDSFYYNGGM